MKEVAQYASGKSKVVVSYSLVESKGLDNSGPRLVCKVLGMITVPPYSSGQSKEFESSGPIRLRGV